MKVIFEDLKHGKGKVYARDGILEAEGQFKEDVMTGQGTLYYANGQASYIGDLVQGKNMDEAIILMKRAKSSIVENLSTTNDYASHLKSNKRLPNYKNSWIVL